MARNQTIYILDSLSSTVSNLSWPTLLHLLSEMIMATDFTELA